MTKDELIVWTSKDEKNEWWIHLEGYTGNKASFNLGEVKGPICTSVLKEFEK